MITKHVQGRGPVTNPPEAENSSGRPFNGLSPCDVVKVCANRGLRLHPAWNPPLKSDLGVGAESEWSGLTPDLIESIKIQQKLDEEEWNPKVLIGAAVEANYKPYTAFEQAEQADMLPKGTVPV